MYIANSEQPTNCIAKFASPLWLDSAIFLSDLVLHTWVTKCSQLFELRIVCRTPTTEIDKYICDHTFYSKRS